MYASKNPKGGVYLWRLCWTKHHSVIMISIVLFSAVIQTPRWVFAVWTGVMLTSGLTCQQIHDPCRRPRAELAASTASRLYVLPQYWTDRYDNVVKSFISTLIKWVLLKMLDLSFKKDRWATSPPTFRCFFFHLRLSNQHRLHNSPQLRGYSTSRSGCLVSDRFTGVSVPVDM